MRLRNTIGSLWQGNCNTNLITIRKVPALIFAAVLLAGAEQVWAQYIFGEPENLGPVVNSSFFDAGPTISADGLTLYFASARPGGFGGGDIWMTTRLSTADPWETPVNLGPEVNSSAGDWGNTITADGLTFVISSFAERGGEGAADVWITTRASVSDPWEPPVNLGPPVNTSSNDGHPSISADGLTLFIYSPRPGGFGANDLWVTTRGSLSHPWQVPVNLGPVVNSSTTDAGPNISADGLTLFFESTRPCGYGRGDIWMTRRASTSDQWRPPVNLGPPVNTSSGEVGPGISADGLTLFFTSDRPGGSGSQDLWQIALTPICAGDLNGVCEPSLGEDCQTCPADCLGGNSAGCGNWVCEPTLGEDCRSCPEDCNGKQNGNPSGRFCCGDCDADNPGGCFDPRCTTDGFDCSEQPVPATCCGTGICEAGEDSCSCPADCGTVPSTCCGDGYCDPDEDSCNCPWDCGTPPAGETDCTDGLDEDCDGDTDCDDADCLGDPACCTVDEVGLCADGVDNDCDGFTDCDDTDCSDAWECSCVPTEPTEVSCDDGIDNDCDGGADCDDLDCGLPIGARCTEDAECCSNRCKRCWPWCPRDAKECAPSGGKPN